MTRYEECMNGFLHMSDDLKRRVADGIEKHRKGSFKIMVRSESGKPIPNTRIRITQKTHEFLYGANLFLLDEMETEEKNCEYKKSFAEAFNQATLPFYWKDLEPDEGKPRYAADSPKIFRRPAPDLCLQYCEKNRITPKGHCLTYFAWHPAWVDPTDISQAKNKLEKRYQELAERYADRIHCWEVINELLCSHQIVNYKNAFFKDAEVLEWNFNLAEKYFPNNELVINEAPFVWLRNYFAFNRSPYYMLIERGKNKGARIDAIGIQFHVFSKEWERDMYDPELIMEVLDTYAQFGAPIQITEITIPAYSDSAEDEALQADLLENLYTLWFSHPSVEMITYWNVVDGYAAHAPLGDMSKGENRFFGGLIRFDMSRKPAFERICYLFSEKWNTRETCYTNLNGECCISAFYGDYDVEVDGTHYEISLTKEGEGAVELIIPDHVNRLPIASQP